MVFLHLVANKFLVQGTVSRPFIFITAFVFLVKDEMSLQLQKT